MIKEIIYQFSNEKQKKNNNKIVEMCLKRAQELVIILIFSFLKQIKRNKDFFEKLISKNITLVQRR